MYFGEEEENVVRGYIGTLDPNVYTRSVHPLLEKIAKGVAARMKMKPAHLYSSDSVKNECIALMWEKLVSNYDVSGRNKVYSYLTRIAENYYKKVWRTYRKSPITLSRGLRFDLGNLACYTWRNNKNLG